MVKGNMKNIIISVVLSIVLLSMPFQTAIYTHFAQATDGKNESSVNKNESETENGVVNESEGPNTEGEKGDEHEKNDDTEELGFVEGAVEKNTNTEADEDENSDNEDGLNHDEKSVDSPGASDKEEADTNDSKSSVNHEKDANINDSEEENGKTGKSNYGKEQESNGIDLQTLSSSVEELSVVISDDYEIKNRSLTISWESTGEVENFELYLEHELIADDINSDEREYTIHDVSYEEQYHIELRAYAHGDTEEYASDDDWFYIERPDEEYTPVSIIFMTNDYIDGYPKVMIKGMDKYNSDIYLVYYLYDLDQELYLPKGNFSVVLYDYKDLNVSEQQTFEIKPNKDYMKEPVELKFNVK